MVISRMVKPIELDELLLRVEQSDFQCGKIYRERRNYLCFSSFGRCFAVVQVADTDCGMDEKTGQHIFNKFYQSNTSHAQEGNGLGLVMVRCVVDIVQGDISVGSRLGKGAVFTVCIRI